MTDQSEPQSGPRMDYLAINTSIELFGYYKNDEFVTELLKFYNTIIILTLTA
jgi:hypothetical protein